MNGGTFSWPGTDRANSQREQRKHGNKKPMIRSNWAKKKKEIKKITQKKRKKKTLPPVAKTCVMEQKRFSKESKLVPAYTQAS